MKPQLMLDIETLGTKPGCAILSIAAVPFCTLSPVENFYSRILSDSNHDVGLHIEESTVQWWSRQDTIAREEAFSGTTHIIAALKNLAIYIQALPFSIDGVWGNGASFDCPILEAAYERIGLKAPWKYHQARCYRTLKNLVELPVNKPAVAHNALHDAKSQADHAERILKWLEAAAAK